MSYEKKTIGFLLKIILVSVCYLGVFRLVQGVGGRGEKP